MDYHKFFHQHLQLSRAFVNKLNELIDRYNLNHSQLIIIHYLKDFGTSTLVDIATYLNLEKSTVTRTVNRLENNGFIKQVPGKDKREKRIQLSDSGAKVHAMCRKMAIEFENRAMDGISKEELESAFQILLKIKNNINEYGDR